MTTSILAGRPLLATLVTDDHRISGDLQAQIMSAIWRLERGTVEQVRSELPARYRGAHTTVQTVLNRLSERSLLSRHRVGNAIEYRPRVSEADYLSRLIAGTLAGASRDARRTVLARLITNLNDADLAVVQRLASDVPHRTTERQRRR
jgi:predicted transcriptional regulator